MVASSSGARMSLNVSSPAESFSLRLMVLRFWFTLGRFFTSAFWEDVVRSPDFVPNLYLVVWFILNIVITLASKAMFASFNFPYPMILTAIHLFCTWVMAQGMCSLKMYDAATVTAGQLRGLIVFSLVFTINIWLSNYSLMAVSVAVHQVFRTTIPLFTMGISLALYQERYPLRMIPAIFCVILGVVATVRGDMELTTFGGLVVAAGCAFSSLKGLMSQKAQIGAAGLTTFDLLRVVCPMSVLELLFVALLSGELQTMISKVNFDYAILANMVSQGTLAAALNFVSFKCAALKNPLTMNIAGNVKQVVTPFIAIWLFGGALTASLLFGVAVTFVGALWYGREARIRTQRLKALMLPSSPAVVDEADVLADIEKELEVETPSTNMGSSTGASLSYPPMDAR